MNTDMDRVKVTAEDADKAFRRVWAEYERRIEQHGDGALFNTHEAFGVIAEEFYELAEEIRSRRFTDEVADLAVACLFALATGHAYGRDQDNPTQS